MLLGYFDYFYEVLIFFIFLFLYDRSLAVLIVKINIFNNLDYSVLLVFLMGQSVGIFLKYLFRD